MQPITLSGVLACLVLSPTITHADPAFGFGITILSNGEAAIGVRVFSDNRRNKGAVSVGFDYNLQSESFRPAIGAAYLDRNAYIEATVGLDLQSNTVDFGLGIGKLWNSRTPGIAPPAPAPTPTPTPPPTGGNTDVNS